MTVADPTDHSPRARIERIREQARRQRQDPDGCSGCADILEDDADELEAQLARETNQ